MLFGRKMLLLPMVLGVASCSTPSDEDMENELRRWIKSDFPSINVEKVTGFEFGDGWSDGAFGSVAFQGTCIQAEKFPMWPGCDRTVVPMLMLLDLRKEADGRWIAFRATPVARQLAVANTLNVGSRWSGVLDEVMSAIAYEELLLAAGERCNVLPAQRNLRLRTLVLEAFSVCS